MGFGNTYFVSNMADVLPQFSVALLIFIISMFAANVLKCFGYHRKLPICGKKRTNLVYMLTKAIVKSMKWNQPRG